MKTTTTDLTAKARKAYHPKSDAVTKDQSFQITHEAVRTFTDNRIDGTERDQLLAMMRRTTVAEVLDAIHCLMHGQAFALACEGKGALAKKTHEAAAEISVLSLDLERRWM